MACAATGIACAAVCVRVARYWHSVYGAIRLRACYAMSGTGLAYTKLSDLEAKLAEAEKERGAVEEKLSKSEAQ
eukprot:904249-Rhodomonas_salina.1